MTYYQRQDLDNLDVRTAISERRLAKVDCRTLNAVVQKRLDRMDPKVAALVQAELATRRMEERRHVEPRYRLA